MPNVSSVTKHFPVAKEGFTTTTSSSIGSGAATVPLNSVTGYANGDTVVMVIEPANATNKQAFTGTIDTTGVQVTNVVWTEGTNTTHAAGSTVVDYVTATHMSMLTKGILVHADQDGTLKAGAVDNDTVLANNVVTTPKILDASITTAKLADGAVTSRKSALTIVGATGNTLNPIPTTATDIVNSSVTFTCDVASYLLVTFSSNVQANHPAAVTISLNVDGSDQTVNIFNKNEISSGTTFHATASRTLRIALTAASHTIKIRAISTAASSAVAGTPVWWGVLVAQ